MSLSKTTPPAPETIHAIGHGHKMIDHYFKRNPGSPTNTSIAKRLYNFIRDTNSQRTLGTPAMVAACVFTASGYRDVVRLKSVCYDLYAPFDHTLQALWWISHCYESNKTEDLPTLKITFEPSSWSHPDTYAIFDAAGEQEPKVIKLSWPNCQPWTLSGNYNSACPNLSGLRQCQQNLMLMNGNEAGSRSEQKTITLVEEVPASKKAGPTLKTQRHQGNLTKASEVIDLPVVDPVSEGSMATVESSKKTSESVQNLNTEVVKEAKKDEPLTKASEQEAEWDVIDAADHDDIEKKWVELNGQDLGTEKNGHRGWTSGLKKFFG